MADNRTGFSPAGSANASANEVSSGSGPIDPREPARKHDTSEDGNRRKPKGPSAPVIRRKVPDNYKIANEVDMYTIASGDEAVISSSSEDEDARIALLRLSVERKRIERDEELQRQMAALMKMKCNNDLEDNKEFPGASCEK